MTPLKSVQRVHAEQQRRRIDPPTGTLVVWRDAEGTVHTRTWPNALPHHKTSCRADESKGLRMHRCSRAHRAAVDGYRSWRDGEYQAAELADAGTAHSPRNEPGTYWETHPRPTFKAYLLAMRESAEHDAA